MYTADAKWSPKKDVKYNDLTGRRVRRITFYKPTCRVELSNGQAITANYTELVVVLQDLQPDDHVLIISGMARFQMDRNFLEGKFNDFARFWKDHKSISISGNWCSNPLTSFISTLPKESRLLKMQNFTIHVAGRLHWLLPQGGSHLQYLEQLL
uniref:Uncharacterized protein n=1 Tax=Panagrolaimus superbus TaxID=310955 RepID=A0A914Z192_9BILA